MQKRNKLATSYFISVWIGLNSFGSTVKDSSFHIILISDTAQYHSLSRDSNGTVPKKHSSYTLACVAQLYLGNIQARGRL